MQRDGNAELEQSLIEKAREGDRDAYGELVRQHFTGVVNVIYRLCGDGGLAEEMAQEAFLRAWNHLESFRLGSSLRNWLYRIAVNATLDDLRRRKEENIEVEKIEMVVDGTPGPEALLIAREESDLLQTAIESLPGSARTVLVLREYGELSYQEIASTLEIPIGTVMSRLNYARNRLRDLVTNRQNQLEIEYA